MKLLTNKNVVQKITIAILIVLSVSFIAPKCVRADEGTVGGDLYKPISEFLFGASKAVISILQDSLYINENGEKEEAFVTKDNFWAEAFDIPIIGYLALKNTERVGVVGAGFGMESVKEGAKLMLEAGYELPNIFYSPATIITGKIPLFDINFINPTSKMRRTNHQDYDATISVNGGSAQTSIKEEEISTAMILRDTIATWYSIIRNVAIIGLLLVLIYVGIKIIISSTAAENAKYKKMIVDWLVALCLIFVLHYVMAFAIQITETITAAFDGKIITENGDTLMNNIILRIQEAQLSAVEDADVGDAIFAYIGFKPNTMNFMQLFGYTTIFLVLVLYTVYFTYTYLRRTLYLAFLTIIAPLVCLTYPLDKIKDGQAQAFNLWLREYIFNLLIQPVHLVLYMVLVASATDLMDTNPIYALVAIGFMLPAEKFIRKMFGFEKAGTLGTIGAATGGALVMNAVNSIGKKGKNAAAHASSGGNADKGIKTKTPPVDKMKVEDVFGKNRSDSQATEGSNSQVNSGRKQTRRLPNGETINTREKNTSEEFKQNKERQEFLNSRKKEIEEQLEADKQKPQLSKEERKMLEQDLENVNSRIEIPENSNVSGYDFESPEYNVEDENIDDIENSNIDYDLSDQNGYNGESDYDLGFAIDPPKSTDLDDEKLNLDYDPSAGIAGLAHRAGDVVYENSGNIAKTIIKGAVGGVVGVAAAATLGTVGLATGLTTGDLSNVVKFTVAGGLAGGAVGKGAAGTTERTINRARNLTDIFNEGAYGGAENYAKIKEQKRFMNSRENQRYFKEQLGIKNKQDLDKCMKLAAKYNRFGVTDLNDIGKGIKLQNKFKISDKEAIVATKMSKFTTKEVLVDTERRRKDHENYYRNKIGEADTKKLLMLLDHIND